MFWQNCFALFLICNKGENVIVDAVFLAGDMDGIRRDWFWPAKVANKANKVTKMTVVTIHDGVVRCVWFELRGQSLFVNIIIVVWRDC